MTTTLTPQDGCTVVTGGASGIGLVTARLLLADGARKVALMDLNEPAHDVLEELRRRYGPERVQVLTCNVSQRDEVHAAVAAVGKDVPVSGVVSCAGTVMAKPSLDLTLDDLHKLFDVHLAGSLFTAQAAAIAWIASDTAGAIVNTSSVAANFGWPGRLPYPVAKAGIEALTRTLAVEWARWGIRVNAVSPGSVDSPLMADGKRPPGIKPLSEVADRHALGRVAQPQEVAEAITFLLSAKSSFITGAVLAVDGGFTITKDSAKELAQ
ncbi:SDR family NAD(P)-dependent oxidoreductase [Streptomyces rhizosphaericus]|uniref:SDR family oxidoreductase n=1 Tax=Streptomyces rhizosphaericus TaxID=114699 RepID=A0A6G4AV73_9ACTN|nr:SDR family oxidoreductase [Streptomyces rhizosphaericus]NEW77376.1 SDR family oxidoreductase [Streptomyces rhizosphaericus]